jgi:hypothetical protein
MKHAMLIKVKPGHVEALAEDEQKAVFAEYRALAEDPRARGSARLQPIETATTVRVHDCQTLTTDGPYADTKEVFAGYIVFEAEKLDEAIGMALIGAGVLWATQVPVHGNFLANLAGPFVVAGAGTAFAFIPISIAALAGVSEHQAGLASGLLNTSQQLGGAIGIAIASSVATSHTQTLVHAGNAAPAALTGGFQQALWVLGAIALLAVPAIFALVRRDELSDAVAKTTIREPQPALAGAN